MAVLRELLVCPVCRSSLSWASESIVCAGCARTFPIRSGAPDLTPDPPPDAEVAEQWPLWERLQANGDLAYQANPELNLSVGEREDALRFGRLCELTGSVLDVGCGPQSYPSYATAFAGTLVGIDPLRGAAQRDFAFVQGVGEYLPFPDSTFDRVLFATSLDHMLVPQLTLGEARRVVRPDGRVIVWMGIEGVDPPGTSLPRRAANGVRMLATGRFKEFGAQVRAMTGRNPPAGGGDVELATPEGAVDPFHVAHPPPETVSAWLEAAGLTVDRLECPDPRECVISASPRAVRAS